MIFMEVHGGIAKGGGLKSEKIPLGKLKFSYLMEGSRWGEGGFAAEGDQKVINDSAKSCGPIAEDNGEESDDEFCTALKTKKKSELFQLDFQRCVFSGPIYVDTKYFSVQMRSRA